MKRRSPAGGAGSLRWRLLTAVGIAVLLLWIFTGWFW